MRRDLLPFDRDEDSLREYLEKTVRKPVSLVITDNSISMLSIKDGPGAVSVRLHKMFLSAGPDVIDEIAALVKKKRGSTPLIRSFIKRNTHRLKAKPARRLTLRPQGRNYNLLDLYNSINREYFDGKIAATITWGTKGPKRAARRRTLGSYSSRNNLIRINPILDSKRVPRYFLEFIIYHEMLHADLGTKINGGGRSVHFREFRRRERHFRHYEKAAAWEKNRL